MKKRMPVLFAGHGTPMNAIEQNEYTETWTRIGKQLEKPRVILSVSAHWYTEGTRISDTEEPQQIYDMYGFPNELYQLSYPVKGSPADARRAAELIGPSVITDNSWGIDHGTWSVLCHMFPEADIPVLQLSVNGHAKPQELYEIGKRLSPLREEGVLIFGSGNVVHHLGRVNWSMGGGEPWALEFDHYVRNNILLGNHADVIRYENAGPSAKLAVPTPDHFYPLLYVLGASDAKDNITVFNDSCTLGSLSMTGYLFEA